MGSIELLGFKINIKWLRKIPAVTGSNLKTLHNKIQKNCYKNHFLLKAENRLRLKLFTLKCSFYPIFKLNEFTSVAYHMKG